MSDQTHSTRIHAAWRDRISAELKDPATVEDLGLSIEPDIHIPATHVQAPDESGVHDRPRTAMRYEPLVRSVAEWQALQSLDPDVRGPAVLNVHVPPHSGIRTLRRIVSGDDNGVLIDPLAAAFFSPETGPSDAKSTEPDTAHPDQVDPVSIREELLRQGSEHPVVGCVDAYALHTAGASASTTVAWSLLSLSAWLDSLDAVDLEAGGRLERIRILAPVGNRPIVDAALLTAIRDLSSTLIRLYARANGGPDRPVSPVLHAISSRSAMIRSAAPADDAGNLVRATLQAVAASSAGADILSLLPYDAHRSPDADSIRLSVGIHRMLHHESGLHRTYQPYAGSYVFETIVRKVSDRAWARFIELARQGSPEESLKSSLLDGWIKEGRHAAGQPVRVGLDRYVPDAKEQAS